MMLVRQRPRAAEFAVALPAKHVKIEPVKLELPLGAASRLARILKVGPAMLFSQKFGVFHIMIVMVMIVATRIVALIMVTAMIVAPALMIVAAVVVEAAEAMATMLMMMMAPARLNEARPWPQARAQVV